MRTPLLVAALATLPLLAGCTQNTRGADSASGDARTVTVSSTDKACDVSPTKVPAGPVTFTVTNDGSEVTEFYLLDGDGQRIIGEVENIGPQLSRELVVHVGGGTYTTACKPGMKGDGIRGKLTVTGSSAVPSGAADDQQLLDQAQEGYEHYVREESEHLLAATKQFAALYESGKDDQARALYPRARQHWERIETVAESFGDLDPRLDAREADLEDGQKWTGWHRIEKDLWPPASGYSPLSRQQRTTYAEGLVADTATLDRRIQKLTYTVDQVANGSRGLLEEVAKGKVTGEEEVWSHTDLWDFQANVDGAHEGFEGLEPILHAKDPELAETLDKRFAALQRLLDRHRRGSGFVAYDTLTHAEVQRLANAVNALSEPLSELTAAVLS